MRPRMLQFIDRGTPVHRLSGTVKLIVFVLWSILAMTGYNTPVMLAQMALGIALFIISKTKISDMSFIFKMFAFFMALNLIAIYIFAPEQGVQIYGSRHLLAAGAGRWTITAEQLFYEFNILLKYAMIIPAAILLIVTTNPSEFAASLSQAGAPYTVAWSVSLALRYIPDIQRDYHAISEAMQARGVELSRKASILARLKGSARILIPLVFSSLARIDIISRAMELRSFGKYKNRTWYVGRRVNRFDIAVLAAACLLFAAGMFITFRDGSRFYNPFR